MFLHRDRRDAGHTVARRVGFARSRLGIVARDHLLCWVGRPTPGQRLLWSHSCSRSSSIGFCIPLVSAFRDDPSRPVALKDKNVRYRKKSSPRDAPKALKALEEESSRTGDEG